MKIARRCLLVYLITFLALFLSRGLWNDSTIEYLTTWVFYIFPLFVVAAGLVLGWLGLMIIQHSRWIKSFYLAGLSLSGIAIIVFFPGQALQHAWYTATHPGAKYDFEDHGRLKGSDISSGFDKLYFSFPHPRNFHFRGHLVTDRPPAGPGYDTTWIVYYLYRLHPDTVTIRFSKVEFNRGRIDILSRNQLPDSDTAYCRLAREYNKDMKEKIGELIEAFHDIRQTSHRDSVEVPDSVFFNALRDTFPLPSPI